MYYNKNIRIFKLKILNIVNHANKKELQVINIVKISSIS